jgi:hypothetical protein
MDEAAFWSLIEAAGRAAGDEAETRPEELEYRSFLARSYTWDLWGAAYVINGGCSDDGFDYFRDWLISKGRRVYAEALRSPETLADAVDDADLDLGCELEELRYVPARAWALRTGKDEEDFPQSAQAPQPAEPAGSPWSEDGDELARRFPKLAAKFG